MKLSRDTFYNKPILGFFNNFSNDFEEHNGSERIDNEFQQIYWDCNGSNGERILGLIRESDNIEIVNENEVNWIKLSCAIWTQYAYRQVKKLLKSKRKKVSVEIEVVDYEYDTEDVMIIKKFILQGITILGDKISEGIPDAHLSVLEAINNEKYSEKVKCLSFAYDNDEESDDHDMDDDDDDDEDTDDRDGHDSDEHEEGRDGDHGEDPDDDDNDDEDTDDHHGDDDHDDGSGSHHCSEDEDIDDPDEDSHGDDDNDETHDDDHDKDKDHDDDDDERPDDDKDDEHYSPDDDEEDEEDEEESLNYCDMRDFICNKAYESGLPKSNVAIDFNENHLIVKNLENNKIFKINYTSDNDTETNKIKYNFSVDDMEEEYIYESIYMKNISKKYSELEGTYNKLFEDYSTLDEKFNDSESKCSALETKCGELEGKCETSDQKCSDLEEKCRGLEEKCSNLEIEIKNAKSEGVSKAGVLMIENESDLNSEDKEELIDKCNNCRYSSLEEVETDIATRLYRSKKNKTKTFSQNIVNNQKSETPSQAYDVWERWGIKTDVD